MANAKAKTAGLVAGSVALFGLLLSSVQLYEGRSLQAYQDIVGVWTICYGETLNVHKGDTATPEQCSGMLAKRLKEFETKLDRCMTGEVPGKSKVAFISWSYNVGIGAACSSTLVKKVNRGDVKGACDELLKWNKAGGRVVKGLVDRRAAERKTCLEGLAA